MHVHPQSLNTKSVDLHQAEKNMVEFWVKTKYSYQTEWEQQEPPGGEITGSNAIVIEVLKGTNKMNRVRIEGSGWDWSNWVYREKER